MIDITQERVISIMVKYQNFVKDKKSLQLNGNKKISFDQIELISRNSKKKIQ